MAFPRTTSIPAPALGGRVGGAGPFAALLAAAGACALLFAACQLPGLLAAKSGTPLPTISPGGGDYSGDQSVTISDSASGATIYYTTDGSTPTTSSARYSGPIPVIGNGTTMTIKAIAVAGATSPVAAASFTISYAGGGVSQAATPQFSPAAGSYSADQSVAISDATSGAAIYYTTDGSTPTTSSSLYAGPIAAAGNGTRLTLRAMAVASGLSSSAVVTAAYTINYGQVSTPSFNISGGSYSTDQGVTVSDATSGATIHYTATAGATGTAPTLSSPTYSGTITVAGSGTVETIEAMGVEAGMANSTVAVETITINYAQVSTPQIGPPTGSYPTDQSVYLSTSTSGATIHYTVTAGSTGAVPTTSSPTYTGPISVAGDGTVETIEAMAVATGMANSTASASTVSIVYPTAAPAFSLSGGTYSTNQSVSLSDAMSGATIYYTTDGSTPTTSSTVYSGPIAVAGDGTTETIKAIAVAGSRPASPVSQQGYAIVYPAATPTFSVAGGMYGSNQSVSLSDATSGVTIYYTTDGSTPTYPPTGSTQTYVTGTPISIAGSGTTEIVSAIAASTARPSSPVASATYSVLYAPTGLAIASAASGTLPVSWNAVGGASSYQLTRDTSPSFSAPTTVCTTSGTNCTDASISSATTYYYRVAASDSGGTSPASATASATTLQANGMPVVTTSVPTGLPAPNSLLSSGDYWVSNPGNWSPEAYALIEGGYTYLVYTWDANNGTSIGIAAYNNAGSIVNQWLFGGARYCTSLSEVGSNIVVSGCQAGATVTIPWSSIQQ